jgi:hypothetical protein
MRAHGGGGVCRAHNADLRVLVIDSADAGSLAREAEAGAGAGAGAGLSLRGFVAAHLRALGLGDTSTGPDPDTVIAGLMRDLIVVFNKHDLHDITTELDAAMLSEAEEEGGQVRASRMVYIKYINSRLCCQIG